MSNNGVTQPAISLPKGGGALKGIGETFQPNLFTGTGNHSIPIAISPGRNGFGPTLSLQYSSGNGNGPFGLGWQLSIPRITRKTEKGLPQYDDTDVFVMSGAEDLVPLLKRVSDPTSDEESWVLEDPIHRPSHTVYRYRPRVEGLFARIERWQHNDTNEIHWRAITRDNVTSIYGGSPASRIADPENEQHVYDWLLEQTFDGVGNHIRYEYARDDPQLYTNGNDSELGLNAIYEQNRKATQLYVRRIYYGNLPQPLLDENGNAITYPDGTEIGHLREGRRYAFEVVFDYGDWDIPTKSPHPNPRPAEQQELFGPDPAVSSEHNAVPIRDDPFSSFRSRFEIRTLRRCRRILMFHHFAELGGPTLVRSTDLSYQVDPDTLVSFLSAVTVTGYRRDESGHYRSASMPPVTFKYSEFRPHEQRYKSIEAQGNDLPAFALNNANVALVDLFGDGLVDLLHTNPTGFRYWKNLGGGVLDRARAMPQIPVGLSLGQAGVGFGDMGGDGLADLLVHSGPLPGFFETSSNGTWHTFKPYDLFPSFDLTDPNLRLLDLTGDGLSDALMTQENHFVWFECLGEKGFAPPRFIPRQHDLDRFPDVFFDDPSRRVRLADMTGSGLNDVVLIHNGRIDYWPNLGYGHFGKRITMENAPHLEVDFDPKRLFLADLNGTGCADLVYVDSDRIHFWFNQAGNRWSETKTIHGTPTVSDVDSIQFADVFGTGTATLVWSYDFAAQPEGNYKALDFCGGVKPHVLTEMSNNMGATTKVQYAPSTKYFLEDQANGKPWVTKLPFPVQVVDKVEVIDHISKTKLVTTYKYHHGYFDGREREFRGFGRVDQFDTETFEEFSQTSLHGDTDLFSNKSAAYHVPPVETRSWFHTGIYFDEDTTADISNAFDYRELTNRFRGEFYQGDEEAVPLGEHDVETGETAPDAYRALHGALLRTEIYAHDGTAKAIHPYQVTETRYRVTQLQPKDGNHHGVYLSHPIESLSYQYERNPTDPRISHSLTLQIDGFGNQLKSLSIGYGRRRPDLDLPIEADREKQTQTFIAYTENSFTNAVDDSHDLNNYRTPLPSETRTYELTGFTPANNGNKFSVDEWVKENFALLTNATEINYEEIADLSQKQKRLLEEVRTTYRKNDLSDLLPLGVLESLALPGETYDLAFTSGLLAKVYGTRVTHEILTDGGYIHGERDDNWWMPSGRIFYSPDAADTPERELRFAQRHFFFPHRFRDPFQNSAFVNYDQYDLLLKQTLDAVGNRTFAEHDYRLLQPFRMTDPNGNRSQVSFDLLGLVAGTAVMGKMTESKGDSLSQFAPDLTEEQREQFMADPIDNASSLLGTATTRTLYSFDRYRRTRQPAFAATLARETHVNDLSSPNELKIQVSISYLDGFGREIQRKIQAESGPISEGGVSVSARWVGTGWTIFNNKGKPVKQYEPFFDSTHEFRFHYATGVSSTRFYDPVERLVATLHPDHRWEKIVFDPWHQQNWDVNDTALITDPKSDSDVGQFFQNIAETEYLPTWYVQRQAADVDSHEKAAAAKTMMHAATPSLFHFDALGRTFLTMSHNRFRRDGNIIEERYATRVLSDIEGNQRKVVDAKDRIVIQYDYDIQGTRIHQTSMDAGERWMLNDVAGQPIHAWNNRSHHFHTLYDSLRRPTNTYLRESTGPENLIGRTVYGESLPHPEVKNQRGRPVQRFDQAGVVICDDYDFKGNLLTNTRQLTSDYKIKIDWSANPELDQEVFTCSSTYDALNRPLTVTSPDGSVCRRTLNEANLLSKVHVNLRGAEVDTILVTNINYDAKGQRLLVQYGNGVQTKYDYDPLTYRLDNLRTTRATDHARLQDLHYTYDPGGNITEIQDKSQQTIYFNNQVLNANGDFTYDALYRLIAAQGREHIGQVSQPQPTWNNEWRLNLPHPGDGLAMRRYTERYEYDGVVNLLRIVHQAGNGSWTREYEYNEPSLLEPSKRSNRLSSTSVGTGPTETYAYDAHGNMTAMPHLTLMEWDFEDRLNITSRQAVNHGAREATYYVYDSVGQRVRKVTERQNGSRKNERIYVGGFETYREYDGSGNAVTLERETLHVTDDRQRIALVETRTQGNDGLTPQLIRYQFANHLRSSSLELDGSGQIISYEEYYPHGSTSYQAVRSQTELPKRYKYTGMEWESETGLSYHTSRYYSPWLGRWVNCDPISLAGGINVYAYCFGNCVRLTDRTGTDPPTTSPPPKIEPIREGMIIGDYPGISSRWQEAMDRVLRRMYGPGSLDDNLSRFKQELQSLPRGSNRTAGTRIYLARRVFTKVNQTFKRMVRLPPGAQVHHAFEQLARFPESSLKGSNLEITVGQAADPRSTHGRATRASDLHAQGVANPGAQATQEMEIARGNVVRPQTPTPSPTAAVEEAEVAEVAEAADASRVAEVAEVGVGGRVSRVLGGAGKVFVAAGNVGMVAATTYSAFMVGTYLRQGEYKKAAMTALAMAHGLAGIPRYVPAGRPDLDPGQPLRPEWIEYQRGGRPKVVVPIGGSYVGSEASVTGPVYDTMTGGIVVGGYHVKVLYE